MVIRNVLHAIRHRVYVKRRPLFIPVKRRLMGQTIRRFLRQRAFSVNRFHVTVTRSRVRTTSVLVRSRLSSARHRQRVIRRTTFFRRTRTRKTGLHIKRPGLRTRTTITTRTTLTSLGHTTIQRNVGTVITSICSLTPIRYSSLTSIRRRVFQRGERSTIRQHVRHNFPTIRTIGSHFPITTMGVWGIFQTRVIFLRPSVRITRYDTPLSISSFDVACYHTTSGRSSWGTRFGKTFSGGLEYFLLGLAFLTCHT